MHTNAAGFLDSFVQDEVKCRCLDLDDFGAPLDNETNDVPLQDMYNRGLVLPQQGRERQNLSLENGWQGQAEQGEQRPGTTGYIPSMEEALEQYPASSPQPKSLVLNLNGPSEEERILSAKRRGLLR